MQRCLFSGSSVLNGRTGKVLLDAAHEYIHSNILCASPASSKCSEPWYFYSQHACKPTCAPQSEEKPEAQQLAEKTAAEAATEKWGLEAGLYKVP